MRLKELRIRKGLTALSLAKQAGVSPSYICALEKGKRTIPRLKIMDKIAGVLGATIQEVFFS